MTLSESLLEQRWAFLTSKDLHLLWIPFMVDVFLGTETDLAPAQLLQSETFYRAVKVPDRKRDVVYGMSDWSRKTVQTGLSNGKPLLWRFLNAHRAGLIRRLKCTHVADDVAEEVTSIMQAFVVDYAADFKVGTRLPDGSFKRNLYEVYCHAYPLKKCLAAVASTIFTQNHVSLHSEHGKSLEETLSEDDRLADPRFDEVALLSLQAMRDVEPSTKQEREEYWAMICLRMLGVTLEKMGAIFGSSKRMLWYRMTNIEDKIMARMKYLLAVEYARHGESWKLAGCAHGSASPVACLSNIWELHPEEGNPLTPLWDEFVRQL